MRKSGDYEGSAEIEGREIKELSEREVSDYLSNKICYVLQEGDLIEDLTVRENIELGSSGAISKDELNSELEYFGLIGFGEKKVYSLSGGEKRRVSLVKAILSKKDILILDEPCYSIDKIYCLKLMERLKELKVNKIAIISNKDDLNCTILIDLNNKKKNLDLNSQRFPERKVENIKNYYRKKIPSFKIDILIPFLIFSSLFFSIFWFKAFENKSEKYFKDGKIFYLYNKNSFFDKSYFNELEKKDILLFNKSEQKIDGFSIKTFYFDNAQIEKLSNLINLEVKKDFCYVSAGIKNLCDRLKTRENCKRCVILNRDFLNEKIYSIKFRENLNYNFLIYKEGSFYPNFNTNNFEKGMLNCSVNEIFIELYPKLKKTRKISQIALLILSFFIGFTLIRKKNKHIEVLSRNGIERKSIFYLFVKKITFLFLLSFICSSILFYFFTIEVSDFIKISFLNEVLIYNLKYLFSGLMLSFIAIFIDLNRVH